MEINNLIRDYLAVNGPSEADIEEVGENLANAKACLSKLREVVTECNQWIDVLRTLGVEVNLSISEDVGRYLSGNRLMFTKEIHVDAKMAL